MTRRLKPYLILRRYAASLQPWLGTALETHYRQLSQWRVYRVYRTAVRRDAALAQLRAAAATDCQWEFKPGRRGTTGIYTEQED